MTTVYSLTRVEPVPRGGDPGRGLAATVQDPFWMLARQRQFGELTGEDAGSPVQVAFVQTEARLDGWKPESGAVLPYSPVTDVVEALAAGEAAGPAHSTLDRLQAGRALAAAVSKSVGAKLRAAFPLPVTPDSPRMLVRAATMFADGLAVAAAVAAADDGTDADLGTALKLPTADAKAARADLTAFAGWCGVTFGTGPNSWVPERLERRFELAIGGAPVLGAPGHTRERVDWYDFDFVAQADPMGAGTSATRARVPTTIQFPGQPCNRFWEFEEATLALSRIDATTTDLGRLALVEFSTIYGNDWFTFPIPVTYGSMQAVSDLVVRDTFGTHELIAPAADPQWAMYRPTGEAPTLALSHGDGTFQPARLVLSYFGVNQGWRVDQHPRVLADLTGDGRADIVGFGGDGVWTALNNGDGTFQPARLVLSGFGVNQGWRVDQHPRVLADLTGDGRADIVGFGGDGVWTALNTGDGTFQPARLVLSGFGVNQGWRVDQHPRVLADLTGDGRADIVGFGGDGVWTALNNGDGTFQPARLVFSGFGVNQGWRVDQHPRVLADLTGDGRADIVGFGGDGVWTALNNGDGTFQPARLVLSGFGVNQGWRVDQHPRVLADLTGDGRADIVGFGGDGVAIGLNNGDGTFAPAQFVLAELGFNQFWRVDRHPRVLADLTGDGRADIVGFGDDGVSIALNTFTTPGSSIVSPALAVPSVTVAPLAGDVVEKVRFLRDEMANVVWGVEQVITDADGNRRDLADEYVREVVAATPIPRNAAVAYRLMTDVPEHWVPFIPVHLPGGSRQVGLVEALLPRPHSLGDLVTSSPRSSVLQELRGLVIPEEEVPTAGVVVGRRWFLARSADGGRHAWASRSVTVGRGEGASGLRFDVADPVRG